MAAKNNDSTARPSNHSPAAADHTSPTHRDPLPRHTPDEWQARYPELTREGNQLQGPCPNCGGDDRFWVNLREPYLIGCRQCEDGAEILRIAFPIEKEKPKPRSEEVARWRYTDANGDSVDHVRYCPKKFGYDPRGKTGKHWFPRMFEPLEEPKSGAVVWAEGEKAAAAIRDAGYVACCAPYGAPNNRLADFSPLAGRTVIIFPDDDVVGRLDGNRVAEKIAKVAAAVLWITTEGKSGEDAYDYTKAQIDEMILAATPWTEPVEEPATRKQEAADGAGEADDKPLIRRDSTGIAEALSVLGLDYRRNIRRARHELRGPMAAQYADGKQDNDTWGSLTSGFLAGLKEELANRFTTTKGQDSGKLIRVPARMSVDAMVSGFGALGGRHRVDPWQDYLESLPPWDGVERVDGLIQFAWPGDYPESPDYLAAASWQIAGPAVGRTYYPGIVADCTPVLYGPQGLGKTAGLKKLIPDDQVADLYAEGLDLSARDEKWVERTLGSVIAEFGELTGIDRADLERLKVLLSRCVDANIRLAYERATQSFRRQWIGVGTANPTAGGILPDDAQNRRFLVVRMPGHDTRPDELDGEKLAAQALAARQWIGENRDQIWAESLAMWREKKGNPFWLPMKDRVSRQQSNVNEGLRRSDVTAVSVADDIHEHGEAGKPESLVSDALNRLGSRANPSRNKIWGRLAELGWTNGWKRVDGKPSRAWTPP